MFEVWAPRAGRVELQLESRTHPMERHPAREGWWQAATEAAPGARYGFALDGGRDPGGPITPARGLRHRPPGDLLQSADRRRRPVGGSGARAGP
jgi:maltooligosyltrehalose trehalohydrolase